MKNEKDAFEGEWDFDGSCAPSENVGRYDEIRWNHTFSLGCFQWVKRGKNGEGKGLKKGRVMYRVKGYTDSPKEAYEKARAYCAKKNAQGGDQ